MEQIPKYLAYFKGHQLIMSLKQSFGGRESKGRKTEIRARVVLQMVLTPLTFCEPGEYVLVKVDRPGCSRWERYELEEGRKRTEGQE